MNKKESLKQILIAVLIGTAISFLTNLTQGLLSWLQNIDLSSTGSVAGAAAYLTQKFKNLV